MLSMEKMESASNAQTDIGSVQNSASVSKSVTFVKYGMLTTAIVCNVSLATDHQEMDNVEPFPCSGESI